MWENPIIFLRIYFIKVCQKFLVVEKDGTTATLKPVELVNSLWTDFFGVCVCVFF